MRGSRISETRRARTLRRNQAAAESQLWRALRGRGLGGFKFVRQEPVGPYFADFACREQRLIIEIDGATHSTDTELRHDHRRAGFLHAQGYRIVRVTNEDVYRNLHGVLETTRQTYGLPLILAFSPHAGRKDESGPLRQILEAQRPGSQSRPVKTARLRGIAAEGRATGNAIRARHFLSTLS
jgi:very-short-patch-repair endonuclease